MRHFKTIEVSCSFRAFSASIGPVLGRRARVSWTRVVATLWLLLLSVAPSFGAIYETANHGMSGASFGIAWINGSDIMQSDGYSLPQVLVAGANANKLGAGNINGAGGDEVVYVSGGALNYYNFATNTTSGPFGGGITDIAVGKFTAADAADQVFMGTVAAPYSFEGVTNTFTGPLPGAFTLVTRGKFTSTNYDQFSVVNSVTQAYTADFNVGGLYFGNFPYGSTFTSQVAGNLTPASGDEIWLTNTLGALYIAENITGAVNFIAAGGTAGTNLALAVGNVDGSGQKGYVLGGDNSTIFQYVIGPGFNNTFATNPSGWSNFIFNDINNDGKDEMFAIGNGQSGTIAGRLYRLDFLNGEENPGTFNLVPEPSSLLLLGLSAVGLVRIARRRTA